MENELKVGDVVYLKSDGPTMTIEKIGKYNYETKAYCSWFVEGEKKSDVFALEALVFLKN